MQVAPGPRRIDMLVEYAGRGHERGEIWDQADRLGRPAARSSSIPTAHNIDATSLRPDRVFGPE